MQCAVVNEWTRLYPALLFFSIPNGDYRSFRAGMRLRNEGLRPGVPDLCVPHAAASYHGLFVELKMPGNYPNETQADLIRALRDEGYYACWCDGYEDAVALLRDYMRGAING